MALQAESNRYVLYVGNPCPWCHRAVLTLVLQGLTRHISIVNAVDDPERASRGGWVFDTPEPVFGCNDLRQVASSHGLHARDQDHHCPFICHDGT